MALQKARDTLAGIELGALAATSVRSPTLRTM
jgi:hypothetical protein